MEQAIAPLRRRLAELESENARLKAAARRKPTQAGSAPGRPRTNERRNLHETHPHSPPRTLRPCSGLRTPRDGQGRLTDRCKPWLSAFCTAYQRREITVLRVSVGILYLWFGILKFIPALSPAEDIATVVMGIMTFDAVPTEVTAPLLALMEVLIGIGLVTGRLLRLTLVTFFVHMAGVFVTLAIVPGAVWSHPSCRRLRGSTSSRTWSWWPRACPSPRRRRARLPDRRGARGPGDRPGRRAPRRPRHGPRRQLPHVQQPVPSPRRLGRSRHRPSPHSPPGPSRSARPPGTDPGTRTGRTPPAHPPTHPARTTPHHPCTRVPPWAPRRFRRRGAPGVPGA